MASERSAAAHGFASHRIASHDTVCPSLPFCLSLYPCHRLYRRWTYRYGARWARGDGRKGSCYCRIVCSVSRPCRRLPSMYRVRAIDRQLDMRMRARMLIVRCCWFLVRLGSLHPPSLAAGNGGFGGGENEERKTGKTTQQKRDDASHRPNHLVCCALPCPVLSCHVLCKTRRDSRHSALCSIQWCQSS